MLTGRIFDVEEALQIGLIVEVHDDDALINAAMVKASLIMANAPMGVAMTKEGMWTALEVPMQAAIDLENRQQIMLVATEDHREAMSAFVERRTLRSTCRPVTGSKKSTVRDGELQTRRIDSVYMRFLRVRRLNRR